MGERRREKRERERERKVNKCVCMSIRREKKTVRYGQLGTTGKEEER